MSRPMTAVCAFVLGVLCVVCLGAKLDYREDLAKENSIRTELEALRPLLIDALSNASVNNVVTGGPAAEFPGRWGTYQTNANARIKEALRILAKDALQ